MIVRRFGSDMTHIADVPATLLTRGEQWGAPVLWVDAPVVTHCGAVLRGKVVKMQDDQRVTCRACSSPPYSPSDMAMLRTLRSEQAHAS